MYAKRINETEILALSHPYLTENGWVYTNPTEVQLRQAGFKPLVLREGEKEPPLYTVYYEEDEEKIYICYREVKEK